ncbi:MAG: CerR family C-terminal domain-containing protein, partial [Burkholderiaceae bacterium]
MTSPRTLEPPGVRARQPRSDGEQSRARLLHAALLLFADKGYTKTSTREIAEAAGTNVASISYYFGDKAGLYRTVFSEPMGDPDEEIARFADPALSLEQALRGFFIGFIEPLRQGDLSRRCMKLHMREMLEPTGLWQAEIERSIRPSHEAFVKVLQRQLGVKRIDDELHRLAVALAALGVYLHVGRDITDAIAPRLNAGARALDVWLDRLVGYGVAMVGAERARRGLTSG